MAEAWYATKLPISIPMARYQVLENLIDQLKILLKKEALLESFNPNDPSIPPLPTLEEAIAGIGTSDDELRCKHCKGELLRGSESIICVYCGHGQQQEFPPQAIAPKSMLGFGWLLQSLRLDGSESVGPPIAGTPSNREQKSLKDGMALSDFLNLDLKWPDESKWLGMIDDSPLTEERPSTLVGVALNELFPEGNRDNPSSVYFEQKATSKKLEPEEADTCFVQKSLTLFENTRSSESVVKSNEGEIGESFSGWEAEFQSAVPDAEHQHMHSFKAIEDPLVNTVSHINSVQGHVEVKKLANMSFSHDHLGDNFTNDNLDSKFTLPSHSKQSERSVSLEDVGNILKLIDGSLGFTWPLDDLQKTSVADSSVVENGVDDDSFDDWNDFRSSTDVENSHCEPTTAIPTGTENRGLDTSNGRENFTGSVGIESNQPKTNIASELLDDSLNVWNDFTVSSSAGDNKLQTLGSEVDQQEKQHDVGESTMLGGNDFTSLNVLLQDGQGIHTDASQNKTFSLNDSVGFWSAGVHQLLGSETQSTSIGTTKEPDDSFNLWNDFKGSTVETQQLNSVTEADNDISVKDDKTSDVWDNFTSLGASKNKQQISGGKSINDSFASWNDDSFVAWNDFTGASSVSVSNSDNDISFGEWNDFSSSAISLHDQHQSSGKKGAKSQTVLQDYDPLSSHSNLRSLETQADNSFPSTIVTESSQGQIIMGQPSESVKVMKDGSPFDAWGGFGHSVLLPDKQSQAGGVELSENKQTDDENDFFSGWIESHTQSTSPLDNQLNSNRVMAHGDKSISENADTSSINVPVNQLLSNSANKPADEDAVKNDDVFDSWNVLASSSDVQTGDDTTVPKENMPEISLFRSVTNFQGVVCDSTYQQDLFLSVTSDQNGSSQEVSSPPVVPHLVRPDNGGGKADGYSAQINQIESTKGTSDLKPSDAEILISKMHDLSFMLENSLSIPKTKSSE